MSREAEERLFEMVSGVSGPVEVMDASVRCCDYLLGICRQLAELIEQQNAKSMESCGEPIVAADPLLGGLLLALIGVVMDENSSKGVDTLTQSFQIPTVMRVGVRARMNALLDAIGLRDDDHILN